MATDQEKKDNTIDIPPQFIHLPLAEQQRIRRQIYLGSIILIFFVFIFVAGTSMFTSYKKRQAVAEWQPPGIPVKIQALKKTSLHEVVEATGIIQPNQEVTVFPEVSGRVKKIMADMGTDVEQDSPLAVIDDELIRLKIKQINAQITKLTAMHKDAEKNLERLSKLFKRKTVSETDLDQARLAAQTNKGMLAEARAQLEIARYELRHTTVLSPIPGKVAERFLEVGSSVSPQVPIARIVNIEKIKLTVGLLDDEIKRVHTGQQVTLEVDAFPGIAFKGLVTAVGSQADSDTLTFPVQVEKENKDPKTLLLPGMIARLSIKVNYHSGVIVVPREIIHEDGNKFYVFVVIESQAKKRTLSLGPQIKEKVIITSGLKPDDKVVTIGHEVLIDGLKVQVDTKN